MSQDDSDEKTFDMNSFFRSFQKYLPYLIILVITIIAIKMVAPVFQHGIPMNIDLPGKYERVWCYQEFRQETGIWSLPTTMCKYKNTGDAIFQAYPPLFYMMSDWLSFLTGLELAFKLVLVFTYFLPAIGAFLLFYFLRKPLAGAFAYGLLLVELGGWHKGGFEETFNVGMSSNSLASGFFILTIALLVYFLLKPSTKVFLLMTLSATLMFLAHGLPFVFFACCLVVFAIVFHKHFLEHWKLWLMFPLLFFLLIGFWLVPYLFKADQFNSGTITRMDWSGIISYFWGNLNYWTFSFGVLGIFVVVILYFKFSKKHSGEKHSGEKHSGENSDLSSEKAGWLSPMENKIFLALAICVFVIPLLWFWSMALFPMYAAVFKIGKYLILIRLHAELRTLLFVFAALFLGYIAIFNIRFNKSKVPVGLFVALVLFIVAINAGYGNLRDHSFSIKTSSHPDFQYQWKLLDAIKGSEGRIFVQDTLYNRGTVPNAPATTQGAMLSHSWCAAPILSGKEFTGTLPWYYYKYNYEFTEENRVILKEGREFTPDETDDLMRKMNAEYVIAYHPYFRAAFEHYEKVGVLPAYHEKAFPWVIYKTNITLSYFELSKGTIQNEHYNGLKNTSVVVDAIGNTSGAYPGSAILTFKFLYYPNWEVRIDGVKTKTIARSDGHIDVIVPAGKHIITYDYVMLPVDFYSYLFPLAGVALCILLWLGFLFGEKKHKSHLKKKDHSAAGE